MGRVCLVVLFGALAGGLALSGWPAWTPHQGFAAAAPSETGPYGFEGRWGMVGTNCATRGDLVPTEITSTEVLFYESRCTIVEVEPIGDPVSTWAVKTECHGEGDTWIWPYVLAFVDVGQNRRLVVINMDNGSATVREACH